MLRGTGILPVPGSPRLRQTISFTVPHQQRDKISAQKTNPPLYLAPYQQAAAEHGPSFQATLWHSQKMQQQRFAIMAGMFDFRSATILDAGAGLGDFAGFLHQHKIKFREYLGIDGVASMVEKAQSRRLRRARFAVADFAAGPEVMARPFAGRAADVIVFCGSLNTFGQEAALATLEKAWQAAGHALLFNFLSARNTTQAPRGIAAPANRVSSAGDPAGRFDPLGMLDWALAKTPKVRFRQDYFAGHDATVAMVKEGSGPQ